VGLLKNVIEECPWKSAHCSLLEALCLVAAIEDLCQNCRQPDVEHVGIVDDSEAVDEFDFDFDAVVVKAVAAALPTGFVVAGVSAANASAAEAVACAVGAVNVAIVEPAAIAGGNFDMVCPF
jgi:hypothetical protein